MTWADLWWTVGLPFTVAMVPLLIGAVSVFFLLRLFVARWRR